MKLYSEPITELNQEFLNEYLELLIKTREVNSFFNFPLFKVSADINNLELKVEDRFSRMNSRNPKRSCRFASSLKELFENV